MKCDFVSEWIRVDFDIAIFTVDQNGIFANFFIEDNRIQIIVEEVSSVNEAMIIEHGFRLGSVKWDRW